VGEEKRSSSKMALSDCAKRRLNSQLVEALDEPIQVVAKRLAQPLVIAISLPTERMAHELVATVSLAGGHPTS
jgi:hypothetical protein